jgi:hypothetical protein
MLTAVTQHENDTVGIAPAHAFLVHFAGRGHKDKHVGHYVNLRDGISKPNKEEMPLQTVKDR